MILNKDIIIFSTSFFKIKHSCDGPIENTSDDEYGLDNNDKIGKSWYITRFNELSEKFDKLKFVMLNADVYRFYHI